MKIDGLFAEIQSKMRSVISKRLDAFQGTDYEALFDEFREEIHFSEAQISQKEVLQILLYNEFKNVLNERGISFE